MRKLGLNIVALGLMLFAFNSNAALVEFTYTEVVTNSNIQGVSAGDTMTLTLLADNGNADLNAQEWLTSDLISGRLEVGSYWQTYIDNWWWSASTVTFQTDGIGYLTTRNFNGTNSSVNHQDSFGVGGSVYLANNVFIDYFGNIAWFGSLSGSSSWVVSEVKVPEPGSVWLLLSGIFGLIITHRRKQV